MVARASAYDDTTLVFVIRSWVEVEVEVQKRGVIL